MTPARHINVRLTRRQAELVLSEYEHIAINSEDAGHRQLACDIAKRVAKALGVPVKPFALRKGIP